MIGTSDKHRQLAHASLWQRRALEQIANLVLLAPRDILEEQVRRHVDIKLARAQEAQTRVIVGVHARRHFLLELHKCSRLLRTQVAEPARHF